MGFLSLRFLMQLVAVVVWARQLGGASRTFKLAKGERPSARLQLFGLAIGLLLYAIFNTQLEPRLVAPGLLCLLGALFLFEWARRSIRGLYFSYAYSNDTPEFVWTSGPFAYVRNPFYTSYLLSYIGAALLFPGWLPLLVIAVMTIVLNHLARREEQKFERSPLAADYAAYRKRTGRFIPKLP